MEKKKMKIRRFLSVFLLTLLLTGLFCVPQASAVDLPQVNAKAALLMDYESGRTLYGLNERDTEYPASITKVMTALLTLEAVDQGVLTLDQQVAAPSLVNDMDPTGSSADIKEGEVLTVEQLLYCMMLVSANEAACILAETVAGSQDAFVALMNQRAQELGCTGTHFVNPNGLHDPNHYSTAWDIYLFTRESLRKNAIVWFVVVLLAVVSHSDLIPGEYGSRIILLPFIPSDWTLHAFGMSGVLTSLLMQRYADRERPGRFIGMLCALGVGMLVLALVSHPFWIISKIQATPTWLFYCLAMFFPLFGFFYWLTDVKGKTNWFDIIKPAGTATLTCYIIPYIWYAVQQLLHLHYPEALGSGVPGLIKSLVFSLVIVGLTGLLVKVKIKLKV